MSMLLHYFFRELNSPYEKKAQNKMRFVNNGQIL